MPYMPEEPFTKADVETFLKEISKQLKGEAHNIAMQCKQLHANGNMEGAELLSLNANMLLSLSKIAERLGAPALIILPPNNNS